MLPVHKRQAAVAATAAAAVAAHDELIAGNRSGTCLHCMSLFRKTDVICPHGPTRKRAIPETLVAMV